MANKKISIYALIVIIIAALSVFGAGCAKRGTIEPDYSKAVAEDFLAAVSASDYDSVSAVISEDFKKSLKSMINTATGKEYTSEKEAFADKICKPINEKIGKYEKGSLSFVKTLSEKGCTSVFYKSEYSKEAQGDVTVQFVYEESEGKMLVGGIWFSSKTLKQQG
jgi:hypothetical protein